MEEVIRIRNGRIGPSEASVVDARQLHEALGIGRDFSPWMRAHIEDLELAVGIDYAVHSQFPVPGNGLKPRLDFVLTIDTARHLAMAERNDRGRRVRAYLIECEKKIRQELERSAAEADMRLEEVAGAFVLHERLAQAKGMLGFREAARALGARSGCFVAFLIEEGYCYRLGQRKRLAAIERYLHLAKPLFFEACDEVTNGAGDLIASRRTWITPHGLERFAVEYPAWRARRGESARRYS